MILSEFLRRANETNIKMCIFVSFKPSKRRQKRSKIAGLRFSWIGSITLGQLHPEKALDSSEDPSWVEGQNLLLEEFSKEEDTN